MLNSFQCHPGVGEECRTPGGKIDAGILCGVLVKVSEHGKLRNPSFRGHDERTSAVNVGERVKVLIADNMSLQELHTCGHSKH